MGRVVTFLLGLFSAAVFVASAVVHGLSLVPGTVLPMERIVWLHLLAMAAFFAVVIHAATVRKRAAALGQSETATSPWFAEHVPRAVWAIGAALFCYAILNFLHFAVTVEGSAQVRDGTYVLMKKAVVIRPITEAEYHEHRRLDLQGLSGHWMMFAWVGVAYFLFAAPRLRRELENAPAP